jgi:hypothetical protein
MDFSGTQRRSQMSLTRRLLRLYAALCLGLSVVVLAGEVTGFDPDIRSAALVFVACAGGGTYGNVRRQRIAERLKADRST